jgi:hypothetical protein
VTTVVVPEHYIGPPAMGHGGYVAGFFAGRIPGAVQVTLRRPTPVGAELALVETAGQRWELRHGDDLIAEAEAAALELDVPPAPTVSAARAAEASSPSRWDERGVHPICLGCGLARHDDEGLEVAVGPVEVDGIDQVAAVWTPPVRLAGADGAVEPQWVVAALDCPGAMAYIVRGAPAGLLGRIVFEQHRPVEPGIDHVVTGWQIDQDGRKLFAGTALSTAAGEVVARTRQTWFART